MKYDLSKTQCITIVSSESCNLNCKYCEIAKAINKKRHEPITCAVQNSLKNGEYFNNILKIAAKYNIDLNKIFELEFWGQEPTLTMNEVVDQLPIIYKYCPNINRTSFSTNLIDYVERIVSFVAEWEKIYQPTEENPRMEINLQISYDGAEFTEKNRGITPDIIKNNSVQLIKDLLALNLQRTMVRLVFHGVISTEVINSLCDNDEALTAYWLESDEFIYGCYELVKDNPAFEIIPHFCPSFAVPCNGTSEDGKNVVKFVKKSLELNIPIKDKYGKPWEGLIYQCAPYLRVLRRHEKEWNLNDVIHWLIAEEDVELLNTFSSYMSCGFGMGDLKVRYDGTIVHCQNVMYGLTEEELVGKEGFRYDVQRLMLKNKCYPNLLKDEDNEAVQKFIYKARLLDKESFMQYYQITINLMVILAGAGQIDNSYLNDKQKLLRHAFMACFANTCYDNNLQTAGSGFGRFAGWLRFLCNGFLDLVEDFLERQER